MAGVSSGLLMLYSERINQALVIATKAHDGQTRKGTDIPYITHPVAVALLASEYTDDEDVIIGALFHDVLEDVSPDIYSEQEMRADFGDRVTDLVKAVSEDKRPDEPEKPWKDRKVAYIEHLRQEADTGAVVVSAADKTHNLLSITQDYQEYGDDLWSRFNAPKEEQLWYYQAVTGVVEEKLEPGVLTDRLVELTRQLGEIITPTSVKY